MMLAWSVIGLVHNGISFLFPHFSETFALSTAHNGYLTGTLAFFWTLSILVNGPLADRIGQVRLMVPGLVLGAVAFGLSAAVGSVALLYVLTALAGFGCGAIVPASLSFLAEQSAPEKRGLFYGAAQSSYTLIGSAIGAVVFTRLAATAVGWRGSYLVIAGLLALGALLLFVCGRGIPRSSETTSGDKQSFRALLRHRNVVLSTVLACLAMMWYFTVAAYTILYLMEARALSAVAAGAIFAGFGGGGFIGEFGAPFVSDRLGRKTTVVLAAVLGGVCAAAAFEPGANAGVGGRVLFHERGDGDLQFGDPERIGAGIARRQRDIVHAGLWRMYGRSGRAGRRRDDFWRGGNQPGDASAHFAAVSCGWRRAPFARNGAGGAGTSPRALKDFGRCFSVMWRDGG